MPAPPAYKEIAGSEQWKTAIPGDGLMKGKWWEIFGDPELNKLEEQISVSNYSVKQLEAEFRESVALIAVSRSGYYPTVTTAPAVTQSDRGVNAGGQAGHGSSTSFSLPFSASWIPDLWNRVGLAVQNANGTLTMLFAGYSTPKPLPSTGDVLGTNPNSLFTVPAAEAAEYRTILSVTLRPEWTR